MHHHPWRPQGLPLRVCEQGCPVSHPSIHSSKSNPAIHPSINSLRVATAHMAYTLWCLTEIGALVNTLDNSSNICFRLRGKHVLVLLSKLLFFVVFGCVLIVSHCKSWPWLTYQATTFGNTTKTYAATTWPHSTTSTQRQLRQFTGSGRQRPSLIISTLLRHNENW